MRPVSIPDHIKRFEFLRTHNKSDVVTLIQENYRKLQKSSPTVSVVIPAYNEEDNILYTLASLASNTTKRSVEIIVVNNNSTDRTEELVKASGVTCITEVKKGITAARTAGLMAAKGMYVLNADADAIYPSNWIEEMVHPLDCNENIAATYGRFSFIPVGTTPRFAYFFYEYMADMQRYLNKYFREEALNVYGFNSGFRRREGIAVDCYQHPPGSNEDGYLALKLRNQGFGRLHYVTNLKALVWTADRRIEMDGGLFKGTGKRLKKLLFPPKEIIVRADL